MTSSAQTPVSKVPSPGSPPAAQRQLDPVDDSTQIMRLIVNQMVPRASRALTLNLIYSVGFMHICGQIEGARAVDRHGAGKIHRDGDRRAEDSISHLITSWIQSGPRSQSARESMARVKRIHERYARDYSMSNETFVHTIAFFTLQFDHLFRLVGAKGFTNAERTAQVTHWRLVGERLGVEQQPETWEEMERFVDWYEHSPEWFGPTPDSRSCANALIEQFSNRWLPPGLRWVGRPLLLSLHEDHVLEALSQKRPRKPVIWTIRRLVRTTIFLNREVLGHRRAPSAWLRLIEGILITPKRAGDRGRIRR